MKAIWKFPIDLDREQKVRMPAGARLLTVQLQKGQPCIWAEVPDNGHYVDHRVYVESTGGPFDHDDARYLGTFQLGDGTVWHVYDGGESP